MPTYVHPPDGPAEWEEEILLSPEEDNAEIPLPHQEDRLSRLADDLDSSEFNGRNFILNATMFYGTNSTEFVTPSQEEEENSADQYHCPHCGALTDMSQAPQRRRRYYESEPYYYSRMRCRNCGRMWEPCSNHQMHPRVMVDRHNTRVCRECVYLAAYNPCVGCNEVFVHNNESRVCTTCTPNYFECPDCESYHLISESRTHQGRRYCAECVVYRETVGCGCVLCRSTREELQSESYSTSSDPGYLHSWNFRPTPIFRGKGPLFLGMELELETGREHNEGCLEVVRKHLGDIPDLVYLKQDGSINYGFELVTHPMSYEWAYENFPWGMIDDLEHAGAETHARVGLHVHLSRKGFASPSHIYKWMKFIYRNSGNVTRIARRESCDWAAFDPDDRQNIKYYCKGDHGPTRYRAINTQNAETFELRIFKSSTKKQEILAALALSDASVKYTRGLSTTEVLNGGWNWAQFTDWLSNRSEYAPLRNEMEVRGCVS